MTMVENDNNIDYDEPMAFTPSRVELATLTLPPSAVDTGIESGGGGEVVLRASQETVHHIADNTPDILSSATNDRSNSVTAVAPSRTTTCIQAVVDLEKLSELVGMDEGDFVAGLHREANEQPFQLDQIEEEDSDLTVRSDTQGGDISLQETPYPDEEQPLLHPMTEGKEETAGIDEVTLAVDAFVDTLAEVLPTQTAADGITITSEDRDDEQSYTITADVRATTTEIENNSYLGHDAFLLEIPDQTNSLFSGKRSTTKHHHHQNHFVLALPEIHVDTPSDVSELTAVPLYERATLLLPPQLPTDIEDVQLDATTVPVKAQPGIKEVHLDLVVKRKVPLIGYVLLFISLISLSSVGAALNLQGNDVSATLKSFWRFCSTAICLLPFAVLATLRDGIPNLTKQQWATLPLAAFVFTYMTTSFVVALDFTTLANAIVLSNVSPLVIIAGKSIVGLPILMAEGSGAIIGFIGGVICSKDNSSHGHGGDDSNVFVQVEEHPQALFGNLMAFSSSFATAGYIVIAKNLRTSMDLFVFMFLIMTLASFFLLGFMVWSGETLMLSNDSNYGLWGWINPTLDRLVIELFIAIICTMVGSMGYVAVMKYFEPVVVGSVMLMEPIVGTLLAVAVGASELPGLQTLIGDIVVIIGSFLVIYSGSRKTEPIDATEALRPKVTAVPPSGLARGDGPMPSVMNPNVKAATVPEVLNSPIVRKGASSRINGKDDENSVDGNNTRTCVVWE
mmetsp:Transcript_20115/g.28503  ORF Transcript_20115/g.28503 Transcript_20115/m.28503 type:complete len:735 (+) Transcript_20115:106-2310(+)